MDRNPTIVDPVQIAGVELWLARPWRRLLLALLAALLLSVLATLIWMDAASEVGGAGRDLDWFPSFERRLIFWACWALAIEPMVWVGRMCVRHGRHWTLMLLLQIPLSILVARGMDHGVRRATTWITGQRIERPEGPPPFRQEERRRLGRPPFSSEEMEQMSPRERRRLASEMDANRRRQMEQMGEAREERWRERGEVAELQRFYRNRADLGIFFYWAILALGWGVRTYLVGRAGERMAARLEGDLTRAKLANLRNQLNPHFLFNSLHSVGGLIRKQDEAAALGMLSNLAALLRASLESAKTAQSTLGAELDLAEQFLAIEAIRLGDRLSVSTSVEPKLAQTPVPALVLLPLVENAVKYGIAPRSEGGNLEISAWAQEGFVYVEILDDGPGFNQEVLAGDFLPSERRTPIGISNTRARLAGLYGSAGVLQLSNRPDGGARVLMRVPGPEAADE